MTNYICAFNPVDAALKDGAVTVAITISAKSEKMARVMGTVMLEETYPENTGKFDVETPIICEAQAGKPAPTGDSFDEHFAKEYEFNGTDWQKREEEMVVFAKTAPVVRIAAIMLYEKPQFTRSEYSKAVEFVHESNEYPQLRNIAKGIAATRTVSLLNEQDLEALVNTVMEKAQDGITEEEAQKLAEEYLFPAEPTTGQLPVPEQKQRDFEHNYATLDQEIALALLPSDFDPWEIQPSKLSAAKKLIEAEDENWRRWSTEIRIIPTALQIPRETVFAVVREGKELPDLMNDAAARKQFVADRIGITQAESSHDQETGRSGADITEDKPSVAAAPEKTRRTRTKKSEKHAEKSTPEIAANDEPATTAQTSEPSITMEPAATDDFCRRAEILDEVLADTDNLSIWKQVQRTDPRFTKPLEGVGYAGTSINGNYMIMRATEIFGPIGEGWSYEVLEEKMIPGNPLTEKVFDSNHKQVGVRFLRDADGSLFCEQNHSIKIKFWYMTKSGKKAEFESYGATQYKYTTTKGLKSDAEVIKKSLTDAIKKALSMLGFSSDVYMGMHDNPEYLIKNKMEFEIKAASDNADDTVRLREELDEKFKRNTETMRTAVTTNELRGIASTLSREISVHINNAKSRGDKEYQKYLEGRLRRLKAIEDECLTKLTEKQEADQ